MSRTELPALPSAARLPTSPEGPAGAEGVWLAPPLPVPCGAPLVLMGSYRIAPARAATCAPLPSGLVVVLVSRTGALRTSFRLVKGHGRFPGAPEEHDGALRGYFNLDVLVEGPYPELSPGRYVIYVVCGPHVSAPVTATVLPAETGV